MLTGLPSYILITFLLALIATYQIYITAVKNKLLPSVILLLWLAVTGVLAYRGFFTDTSGMPPKFALAVAPAILFIIALLVTKKGQTFVDSLDIRKLTLLHIIRIPVELVLYWLAAEKTVPVLMTFEGRNFDIIAGITAPFMYFVCFNGAVVKNKGLLLAWNFICLALLINIVVNAVLAAPFSFQKFAFDQPNIAVLYFPFVWLPSFIVMLVLFSHLVVIRRLLKR